MMLMASTALSATITIDGKTLDENVDVYGNGPDADGGWHGGWYSGDYGSLLPPDNNGVNIINGSTVNGIVAGGIGTATADHNRVAITDSAVSGYDNEGHGYVYGGMVMSPFGDGAASHNRVAITNGTTENAYGGMVMSISGGGATNNNTITITDSQVGYIGGGMVQAEGSAISNNNITAVSGSNVSEVFGSQATAVNGSATSNHNRVAITDGTTTSVYGGMAISMSGDATANNNTITIDGTDTVDSSMSYIGAAAIVGVSSATGTATANNNTMTITGGKILGPVAGGYIHLADAAAIGTATGNTITVGGTADLSAAYFYGGLWDSASLSEPADLWTGNKLNVKNSGMSAGGIYNFENLNFYLPATMADGETMLSVDEAVDISASKIGVGIDGRTSALNVGDTVTLIDTEAGLTAAGVNTTALGVVGISKIYDFELTWDAYNLYATLRATDNPQTKALSEGQLSGLSFLNQGTDLIAGSGVGNMLAATARSRSGAGVFGAVGGGKSRYKTGSHVDLKGVSLLAGFARKADAITAGAFLEAGEGRYDSYNSFNSVPSVKGKGDTSYVGVGTLGRYDMNNAYGEASARIGRVKIGFSSNDILNGMGGTTEYDTSALYAGAHIGAGYVLNLDSKASVDMSARLLWVYQGGDNVSIAGDAIKFDAATSLRSRAGARYSYAFKPSITPYAGAYLDYEFAGKAEAKINGAPIITPELKGLSVIGELGLAMKPSAKRPLTVAAGIQGYLGNREGISGSLALKYEF
jgi:hypothetical protein